MRIVRLSWAGVQIESERATLVIDLLEHTAPIRSFMGDPRLPIIVGPEVLDLALVTHLHPDHYDPDALRRKLRPDAKVICDPANASKIARDGFTVVGATLYEPISAGPFTVTALPAVDGLGDPQISFLVRQKISRSCTSGTHSGTATGGRSGLGAVRRTSHFFRSTAPSHSLDRKSVV